MLLKNQLKGPNHPFFVRLINKRTWQSSWPPWLSWQHKRSKKHFHPHSLFISQTLTWHGLFFMLFCVGIFKMKNFLELQWLWVRRGGPKWVNVLWSCPAIISSKRRASWYANSLFFFYYTHWCWEENQCQNFKKFISPCEGNIFRR